MKKKILICSLIVMLVLSTATTAFATSFYFDNIPKGQSRFPTVYLDFSVNMHARVTNSQTYRVLEDGTRVNCEFKACLVSGETEKSTELSVNSGVAKNIYPREAGSFRLRVKNPFTDYTITGSGNYQNQYN